MTKISIVRPEQAHRARWDQLYAGYAKFYEVDQTQEMRDRVWGWLHDKDSEVQGFLALDSDKHPIGLSHFRAFARPLSATTGGFLDDLFVDPDARGSGAAQALIEAVAAYGHTQGWSVIRWITDDTNYRARAVYDRLAKRTRWITYDIPM